MRANRDNINTNGILYDLIFNCLRETVAWDDGKFKGRDRVLLPSLLLRTTTTAYECGYVCAEYKTKIWMFTCCRSRLWSTVIGQIAAIKEKQLYSLPFSISEQDKHLASVWAVFICFT